jgi:hypothetical protein
LLLVVLAGAPLLAAASGAFIWTDVAEILDRRYVAASWNELWNGLLGHEFGRNNYYRPTVLVAHSLSATVAGYDPLPWRASGLLVHVLNALGLSILLRRLDVSGGVAAAAGSVFAAHPVAVGVVAWVSARTDLLALSAELTWAHAMTSWIRTGRRSWLIGSGLALLVGLGAKPTVAMVVFLSMAVAVGVRADLRRRAIAAVAVSFSVVVAWALWTSFVVDRGLPIVDLDLTAGQRLALGAAIQLRYAKELLWPSALTVCDAMEVPEPALPFVLLGVGLTAGVPAVAAHLYARRATVPLLALLWAVSFMAPTFGLVPLRHVRADRYAYQAMPGLVTLAVLGTVALARARPLELAVAAVVVVAGLDVASVRRARRFASDDTLWTWEVARNPLCREGLAHLAKEAWQDGDPQLAADLATRALDRRATEVSYVDRARTKYLLARSWADLGRTSEAATTWESLTTQEGDVAAEASYMLGVLRSDARDCQASGRAFAQAEALGLRREGVCDAVVLLASCHAAVDEVSRVGPLLDEYDRAGCKSHSRRAAELRTWSAR